MLTKSAAASKGVRAGARRGVVAQAKPAGNWYPGRDMPAYLESAGLAGTFGFDPAELGKDPASLKRFQEAELIHCRWAMLGTAGALAPEVLGFGNWADATQWTASPSGHASYFGTENPLNLYTLLAISNVGFVVSEGLRQQETDQAKKTYPGGPFDPMGMSKGADFEEKKLKEIKNGRLAMVAFAGFLGQYAATGKGPVEALSSHLANPWANNFATNGVSLPF